jgi:hypothetical protein
MNRDTRRQLPALLLTAQDVATITGRSKRSSQRLMLKIRIYFKRPPRGPVNVLEFSRYMNMEVETVINYLQ